MANQAGKGPSEAAGKEQPLPDDASPLGKGHGVLESACSSGTAIVCSPSYLQCSLKIDTALRKHRLISLVPGKFGPWLAL